MLRYGQEIRRHMPNDCVEVVGVCQMTRKEHAVVVPRDGLFRWLNGAYIQDALADVPQQEREFLITGTSPEGWQQLFGDLEEDEEDIFDDVEDE